MDINKLAALPFKLPTFIAGRKFLLTADHELIMKAYDTTEDELQALCQAVNIVPDFLRLLELVPDLLEYIENATLEGDELPAAYQAAKAITADYSPNSGVPTEG